MYSSSAQHVDNMGELPLSDRPFHLLGIGYGANIATALACQHGERWKGTMRSLACMNGFAAVDTQLAAVLHSAERAFQCFPLERPDLPITFWSRYERGFGMMNCSVSSLCCRLELPPFQLFFSVGAMWLPLLQGSGGGGRRDVLPRGATRCGPVSNTIDSLVPELETAYHCDHL